MGPQTYSYCIDTGNELLTVDTITEEPTDLQMESPKDLFTKENNNNINNELHMNKLNVLPEYENSNTYNTQNKSPISNTSKSSKSKSKTKSTPKIKVTITPVHNDEFETPEPNINDENILFEPNINKEELIITPISTTNNTSKSHRLRKATPAE
eukprot:294538_1